MDRPFSEIITVVVVLCLIVPLACVIPALGQVTAAR